ncbi:MAG: PDZ domain-containing protein [Candidatus Melainabacteria bacterium]|nr:PDZ domain-containing protein [Candidatus Melainabacteria bacterium]
MQPICLYPHNHHYALTPLPRLRVAGLLLALLLFGQLLFGQPIVYGEQGPSSSGGRPTLNGSVAKHGAAALQPAPGTLEPWQATPPREPGIIGLDLSIRTGGAAAFPVIVGIFPNTPAANTPLKPQDELLSVNGVSLLGLSRNAVDAAIPDTPGQRIVFRAARWVNGQRVTLPPVQLCPVPRSKAPIFIQQSF